MACNESQVAQQMLFKYRYLTLNWSSKSEVLLHARLTFVHLYCSKLKGGQIKRSMNSKLTGEGDEEEEVKKQSTSEAHGPLFPKLK